MKRTNKTQFRKVDAILTGDWHLQDSVPVARKDDFWNIMWSKVSFISNLQRNHGCPVVHSGDLFNHWKPSPMLISKAIEHLPEDFITIYGNHDLPQHNLELAYKSGIRVLERAGKVFVLEGSHWGQPLQVDPTFKIRTGKNVGIWHVMTYQGKKPWPNCTDPRSSKILRKYPNYDLILTGHNHIPFTEKHEGRLLVNPGSIFRLTADQQDHKPRVYLWYADTNTVEPVYLPIEEGVISRAHLDIKEKRDNRIAAFITTLNEDWQTNMSFEDNLVQFSAKNNVRQSVMDIIYKSIE